MLLAATRFYYNQPVFSLTLESTTRLNGAQDVYTSEEKHMAGNFAVECRIKSFEWRYYLDKIQHDEESKKEEREDEKFLHL